MASSKSRQRALARAKTERQIARRAAAARRRRQWQAGIGGAVALTLLVLAVIWKTGGFDPEKIPVAQCSWTPVDAGDGVKDVGKPRTNDVVTNGVKTMSVALTQGTVTVKLDPSKAKCTVESFTYLAGKKFFDGSKCHRMLNNSLLQCGDPSGTGSGGPSYRFADENNPPPAAPSADPSADPSAAADPNVLYPAGTVAMANSGVDTNGSQFFLVFKDIMLPPNYTVFGTIVGGMDILTKIGADGTKPGADGAASTDGEPKDATNITTLTVTDVAPQEDPTAAPSASVSAPAASSSASPSASASSKS
ncbi:peptidylprolyl isomerase [Dactylosporangium sp. NPDC049525]|uniref:peptidylprolyl isomerase n=1 Tax=Dactylosporangium sp. NPDC049525 TaxID=3154730 RepID=UPI0034144CFC